MGRAASAPEKTEKRMLSAEAYQTLRTQILHGGFGPGEPLQPQKLAASMGVSLSVVREALQQLIGEGLADRHPNKGFTVPALSDSRWHEVAEARRVLEPNMFRLAIERGDLEWEAGVRSAYHRLSRTPLRVDGERQLSDSWAAAHHAFHRALLEGCGNPVLLDTFERLWTASELARRWADRGPVRDHESEHRRLEQAALDRDADTAAEVLNQHLSLTVAALSSD